jgi:hypothetical protein
VEEEWTTEDTKALNKAGPHLRVLRFLEDIIRDLQATIPRRNISMDSFRVVLRLVRLLRFEIGRLAD